MSHAARMERALAPIRECGAGAEKDLIELQAIKAEMASRMTRDDLIWIMAEAAWSAHHCVHRGDHTRCTGCAASDACFELSGGFECALADNFEWFNAASGALDAFEAATGIHFPGTEPKPTTEAP